MILPFTQPLHMPHPASRQTNAYHRIARVQSTTSVPRITVIFKSYACTTYRTLSIRKHRKPPLHNYIQPVCYIWSASIARSRFTIAKYSKEKNPSWAVLKLWALKTFLASKIYFVHSNYATQVMNTVKSSLLNKWMFSPTELKIYNTCQLLITLLAAQHP